MRAGTTEGERQREVPRFYTEEEIFPKTVVGSAFQGKMPTQYHGHASAECFYSLRRCKKREIRTNHLSLSTPWHRCPAPRQGTQKSCCCCLLPPPSYTCHHRFIRMQMAARTCSKELHFVPSGTQAGYQLHMAGEQGYSSIPFLSPAWTG